MHFNCFMSHTGRSHVTWHSADIYRVYVCAFMWKWCINRVCVCVCSDICKQKSHTHAISNHTHTNTIYTSFTHVYVIGIQDTRNTGHCKRALLKRRYSAKETYNLIDHTDFSHPITMGVRMCSEYIGCENVLWVYWVWKCVFIYMTGIRDLLWGGYGQ